MTKAAILDSPVTHLVHAKEERGGRSIVNTVFNKFGIVVVNAVTGVLTARLLRPEGRGDLAAMILWPTLLTSITTLGIPTALIFLLRRGGSSKAENVTTALLMILILSSSAAVVGIFLLPVWLGREYSFPVIRAAQEFLMFTPVLSLTQAARVVLEAHGRFSLSNKLLLLSPTITLAGLLYLTVAHRLTTITAAEAYMFGAIPALVVGLLWIWPLVGPKLRVSFGAAKSLLHYGMRSFGVDLLGTLSLQFDQLLVITLLPPAAMGAYGVMLSLSRMFNLFQASVVVVLFPKATGQHIERVVELTEQSARISTLVTALCCAFVSAFGFTFLRVLYGRDYASSASTLRILLLEVTLSGAVFILAQAFMAIGRPGIVSLLQAIGLGTSIPLMLYFIPKMGIKGAALALLFSTMTRFLLVFLGFRFVLKTRFPSLLPRRSDWLFVLYSLPGLRRRETC